jgi:hypothetical protein
MVVRLLGVLDLIAALLIVLLHFELGGWRIPLIISLYLVAKGLAFRGDWLSYVDIAIGIYVWLIFIGFTTFFDYLLAAWLVYKGIVSLVS